MRRFEPVAGVGGLLLVVSLFLPWYAVDPNLALDGDTLLLAYDAADLTAWQMLTVIDVLLALLALPALSVPVSSLAARGPAKPIAVAVIASAVGWLAVLLVVIRIVFPPGDLSLRYGIWFALAGALIAWIGSWMSLRDESTPGAVAPDVPRRPAPPAAAA